MADRPPTREDVLAFMDDDERHYWDTQKGTPEERVKFWESLEDLWRSIQNPTDAELERVMGPIDWEHVQRGENREGILTHYRQKWKKDRKADTPRRAEEEAKQPPDPDPEPESHPPAPPKPDPGVYEGPFGPAGWGDPNPPPPKQQHPKADEKAVPGAGRDTKPVSRRQNSTPVRRGSLAEETYDELAALFPPVSNNPDPLLVNETNRSAHRRISRIAAGGLFALSFGSFIQALTLFGVITMNFGHFFMVVAFVAGALLLTTEILPVKPRRQKVVSVIILGLVLLVIDVSAVFYVSWRDRQLISRVPVPTVLLGPTPQVKPSIPIHTPFQSTYDRHEAQLGEPKEEAKLITQAYHAQHEKAYFIWLAPIAKLYVLMTDDSETLKEFDDPGVDKETWYYDKDNIKRLGTPQGKAPPFGAFAKAWYLEPEEWKPFGWRLWHCLHNNETYLQEFERGLVVGGYRRSPTEDSDNTWVYILLTQTNRWDKELLSGQHARCVPPLVEKRAREAFLKANPNYPN